MPDQEPSDRFNACDQQQGRGQATSDQSLTEHSEQCLTRPFEQRWQRYESDHSAYHRANTPPYYHSPHQVA